MNNCNEKYFSELNISTYQRVNILPPWSISGLQKFQLDFLNLSSKKIKTNFHFG